MIASCYCYAQTEVDIYYPAGSTSTNYIYYLTATRPSSSATTCTISCTENPKTQTTLEIPSTVMFGNTECTVTKIGSFNGKTNFVGDLIIPNTVETIQDNAFANCTGFNGTLYLPPYVYFGNKAFQGCKNITSIIISENISCHNNGLSNKPTDDFKNLETVYIYVDISTLPPKVKSWLETLGSNVTIITPENMNTVVSAPTFEPKSGAYTGSFNVTISCATGGATIYYTTDGTVPTTSSKTYTGPITVDENTTIKVYAVKGDMTPIHSQATYTIINSINPPTFSPAEGTYTTAQSVSLTSTEDATIYYTTDGSDPTTSTSRETYSDSGAVQIDGETNIKAVAFKDNQYSSVSTALYHFHVETPTFSPETNTVIENGELKITLDSDTDGATIYFTKDGSDPTTSSTREVYNETGIILNTNTTIKAYAVKDGYEDSYVATAFYSEKKIVLTPTLSPAGGTFTGSISVTISGEEGATIYYTTNGDTPTVGSTKYEGSITLSEPTIIKAIAYKDGMTESQVATGEYKFYVSAPTFSVASGTYNEVKNVEIICATVGATIYYTTNGSEPTTSSTPYAGPIYVNSSQTIKAIAVKEGWENSSIAESEYTLKVPAITYTPDPSAQFTGSTSVSLTCNGATIYYTTDGTEPNTSSNVYSTAIIISETTNIKAIAVREGWENSDMTDLWYKEFVTVGEPVFTPDNNDVFSTTQNIKIECSLPEGQDYPIIIYYKTNDSDNYTIYTQPIPIEGPTTITAYGVVNGDNNIANSPVITKKYDFKVAQPTITAGGSFTSPQTVTIGCTTDGATIYYTTNGDTPTTSSATYSQPIPVNGNATIKAIAVKEGWISSDIVEATYEFNVECPSIIITPSDTYTFDNGSSITISLCCNTEGATIHYTTDGSDPTNGCTVCDGDITIDKTMTIKAIACKEGWNSSQIISATFTEMDMVNIPTLSLKPGTYESVQECIISCATEGATIYYSINDEEYIEIKNNTTINITQSTSISAYAVKEGMTDSHVISETYTLETPIPTFEPKGAKYTEAQDVTINATEGAAIYYTLDGTDPRTSNTKIEYEGPITVDVKTTINATAYIQGWEMSHVVTEIYDFYEKVDAPVISPESGNYNDTKTVTISCVEGATIYYTIDGSTPDINNVNNSNSKTYVYKNTTSITAKPTETTIVKAIAVKEGMLPSDIITANYNDNAILTFIGDGSWYTAENWNKGYVPSSEARVAIAGNLVIYSEETVNAFYINNIGSSLFTGGTITIKDGGQLIYNSADIKDVKIEKEITGYGDNTNTLGWYAFSTPISGTIDNNHYENILSNEYDLFSYDETDWHWHNYEKYGEFNAINLGQGYLYANSKNTTIISKGIPNNGDVSFTLSETSGPDFENNNNIAPNAQDYDLTGFNLVGNPFTFNIGKGAGQSINTNLLKEGYYVLTTDGKWTAVDDSEPIKVGTSIFVETKENDGTSNANRKSITIDNIPYTTAQQQDSKRAMSESESLSITVSNDKYDDIAYIHFGNDTKNGLRKLAHMNEDIQMVYVPINGIHYAIANVDKNVREVPVAFETSTMGKYTISVDASKCSHEEIYLLDNLSNEKIDILDNDYSFIATSSENKERFTLLFINNNDESSNSNIIETFAYICNGEIVIDNIEGSGNVYVYDIMGRPIITRKVNENVNIPTGSLTGGIYIIRLIDNNGIKTQKIIIK